MRTRIFIEGDSAETPVDAARAALEGLRQAGFTPSRADVIGLPEGQVVRDLLDPAHRPSDGSQDLKQPAAEDPGASVVF